MKSKAGSNGRHDAPAVPAVARVGDPAYVSIPFAATYLTVSTPTIRRYLTQKRLRRFKCGSRTLLLFDDVKGLVQEAR